jgi:hypothetical protein
LEDFIPRDFPQEPVTQIAVDFSGAPNTLKAASTDVYGLMIMSKKGAFAVP